MRELVVKVPYDGSTFYYEDGYYIRVYSDRETKIKASSIPDPYSMWERRCKANNITTSSSEGVKLRPNEVTFKLWEHYDANNNN